MKERRIPEYAGAHLRIKAARGPAKNYVCQFCESRPALDWAYDGQDPSELTSAVRNGKRYCLDVFRYIPLCRGCHNRLNSKVGTHLRVIRQTVA